MENELVNDNVSVLVWASEQTSIILLQMFTADSAAYRLSIFVCFVSLFRTASFTVTTRLASHLSLLSSGIIGVHHQLFHCEYETIWKLKKTIYFHLFFLHINEV